MKEQKGEPMGLRNDQSNKVCRILDDVLANRPTERDALIVAVRKAFDALEAKQQWILCEHRMPEEREWIGTKQFGTTISDEVYVTFESPDGVRFAKHLCFQNGKLSNHDQLTIDAFHKGSIPIAWMPLPEPTRLENNCPTCTEDGCPINY